MGDDKARPWRWSEEEFYQKLDDYLEQRIAWIERHVNEITQSSTARLNLRIAINEYHGISYPPDKRKFGCRVLGLNVKDWVQISIDPNSSLEKLMLLYMAGEIYNEPLICIAFMCKNPKLTEEFIEDAMFVGSGLFWFDEWDKMDIVLDYIDNDSILDNNSKANKKLLSVYDEARIPLHVKDRIDWKNINLRRFSKEFINKHKALINKCYKYDNNDDDE